MSGLTDSFPVVDAQFAIEGVGALVTIDDARVLGDLSCDANWLW